MEICLLEGPMIKKFTSPLSRMTRLEVIQMVMVITPLQGQGIGTPYIWKLGRGLISIMLSCVTVVSTLMVNICPDWRRRYIIDMVNFQFQILFSSIIGARLSSKTLVS